MNDQIYTSTKPQHVESHIAEANSWFRRCNRGLLACVGFTAFFLVPAPALAVVAVAPTLGAAEQFGALGNSGVTGSTFPGTVVNGNVGSAPTVPTITNFPPSTVPVPFVLYTAPDPVTAQAHTDAAAAYGFLAGQGLGTPLGNTLNNLTLTPGLYSSGAADLGASTTLTLNDPSPGKTGVFVFNVASSLTMNVGSVVTGTANPCNVYWRVGSSATLNGNSFMGTVIADTSITVGGGNVSGRVLAGAVTATGIVTMSTGGNTIGGCSAPVLPPTLGKTFSPATINAGGVSTLTITLSNPDTAIATLSSALTDTLPGGVVVAPDPAAATTCGGGTVTAIAGAGTVALSSGSTIPATGSCTVTVNVTAAAGGSYINTLNAGALATSNGNNAAAAIATLTVPAIAITTLTTQASPGVTLGGAISDIATLSGGIAPTGAITFNLYGPNDALCAGVAIFTSQVAVSGNGNYSSAPFTPVAIGTYRWVANYGGDLNNLPTANGCNALNESVNVTAVLPSAATGIPTLSEWAMVMLAMLLAIVGFAAMRRQAR
ncbi:MAG: IPTL-CTERM sorting domain-containing protein [Thiobacillus sp.]|nr:IPTL-CTERM sorting domain-containing protein [Thiobacillus sp.]